MTTRALIVESDWSEAQQFTYRLESSGIQVLGVAATGADGLRYCEELRPDLVLLDVDLDGPLSGIDLIVPIRALAPTPLLFVTRDASDSRMERLAGVTSSTCLIKPIDDAALQRALAALLHHPAGAVATDDDLFMQVFDMSLDPMLLVHADGRVGRVNRAFERDFRYSAAEVEGQPVDLLVPARLRAAHAAHRAWYSDHPHMRRMGEQQSLVACRSDGSEFPVDISLAPFGSGLDARVLAIVRDASERRRLADAEREREALEAQLDRVLRLETVGRLAGGIAHDFNNMLMVLGGYADVLLEGGVSPQRQRTLLEGIRATTNRASQLTTQLLAFGRRQVLQPQAVEIADCIEGVRGLMSRAIGESIEIETAIAADLQRVCVDASQFDQVLLNLALNARDAMPKGGVITFEAKNLNVQDGAKAAAPALAMLPAGNYVQLTVRDTGCGMTPDTVTRAFEPFFTTKGPGKGIGMGLASAYGIIRQSGGTMWIDSEPGAGTRVVVVLPAAVVAEDIGADSFPVEAAAPSARILLVEDEPDVRAMLKDSLEAAGYEVAEASDGRAALTKYLPDAPRLDLIVTDVIMPKCGGLELVSAMRERKPDLLAIFISGYANDPENGDLPLDPRTGFLQKPFAIDRLRETVNEMLSARDPRRPATRGARGSSAVAVRTACSHSTF